MRSSLQVVLAGILLVLSASVGEAQLRRLPTLRPAPRPSVGPAAGPAVIGGLTEVSFQLSASRPQFTYSFVPPESTAYTAAATWESKEPIQVSVQAQGSTRPTLQAGVPPVGVGFTATKGQTCTVIVGPKQGVVQTNGQLAILSGSARKVHKPPATERGRLEAALARSQTRDAFLPIFAQLAERYLNNARDKNELDQLFEEGLAKYPRVERQLLTAFVRDVRAVPSDVRARAFTPTALRMTAMAPVTATQVADALRSTNVAGIQSAAQVAVPAAATVPQQMLPRITRLEPDAGAQGYGAGQSVTIVGSGFSASPSRNQIQILAYGATTPAYRHEPESATTSRLTFRLPANITHGLWLLQVLVTQPVQTSGAGGSAVGPSGTEAVGRPMGVPLRATPTRGALGIAPMGVSPSFRTQVMAQLRPAGVLESHYSNQVTLRIKQPPPPKPVITSISPSGQEPSQSVNINGRNFQPGKDHYVYMRTLDLAEPKAYVHTRRPTSSTQISLALTSNLIPGDYAVQVFVVGAAISDAFTYTVATPRYRIVFDRMECMDESNPEFWGSDEIVTFWTVTADGYVWSKNTDEYGGFDDGDMQSYKASDQNILQPTGAWSDVQYGLILITKLYEWDAGDVSAAQDFIGFMGHVAAGIAGITAGLPLAAVIEAVSWFLQEVIGVIISWFGGDPDHLGTSQLTWPYYTLQSMVAPGQTASRQITFQNSGGTGSYRLYYRVMRAS